MPFSIRPDRRFSGNCPATYHAGLREDHGIVWNLSVMGLRVSGFKTIRFHSCDTSAFATRLLVA